MPECGRDGQERSARAFQESGGSLIRFDLLRVWFCGDSYDGNKTDIIQILTEPALHSSTPNISEMEGVDLNFPSGRSRRLPQALRHKTGARGAFSYQVSFSMPCAIPSQRDVNRVVIDRVSSSSQP